MSKNVFHDHIYRDNKIHLLANVNMNTAPVVVGCQYFLPLFCHFFPTKRSGPSAASDESDDDDYVGGHDDSVGGHDDYVGGQLVMVMLMLCERKHLCHLCKLWDLSLSGLLGAKLKKTHKSRASNTYSQRKNFHQFIINRQSFYPTFQNQTQQL